MHRMLRLNRRAWGSPVAWLGNRLTDADSGKEKSRHLTCAVWPPGFESCYVWGTCNALFLLVHLMYSYSY